MKTCSSGMFRGIFALMLGCVALTPLWPESVTIPIEKNDEIFWTRPIMEPDTIASIWLLRRFVAPNCRFEFIPKGQVSEIGTPFDMPLVEFSRTRTKSTFHVIREHYEISEEEVLELERLIDEIEIGGWNQVMSEDAGELERALRACLASSIDPAVLALRGIKFLDAYAECQN